MKLNYRQNIHLNSILFTTLTQETGNKFIYCQVANLGEINIQQNLFTLYILKYIMTLQ